MSTKEENEKLVDHDSSTVRLSVYNILTKTLTVEFKNGNQYRYLEVDENTYDEYVTASSTGKALNEHIKGKFEYEKIEE